MPEPVRANENPPDVNQPVDVLRKLLAVELSRLDTAVKIEQERHIVFPETSVIIRDIQKLLAAVNAHSGATRETGQEALMALLQEVSDA